MVVRGISLLDIIGLPPGSQAMIPDDIAAWLERVAVIDHRSTVSDGAYIHYGTVQSAADMGLPGVRSWPVEIPGLNTGIPFQLTAARVTGGAGNLEGAPSLFNLDLFLSRVAITVPGLRPAIAVPGAGVTAAHLDEDPDPNHTSVRIVGSAVLRITPPAAGGAVAVRFIDSPDSFDPAADTGPVFSLTFEPPSFFIGNSPIGLTIDRLTYDNSETYTPAEIEARGQPDTWRGISIREATLYLPRNAPVIGDLSIGVRDVLLGSPFGLQGELRIELGQTPVDPALVEFIQQVSQHDSVLPAPAGTGSWRTVDLQAGTVGAGQVRGHLPSGAAGNWTLPDGSPLEGASTTGYFAARPGDVVRLRPVEVVDGEEVESPETAFQFKLGTGAPTHAPTIDLVLGGTTRANAVAVSGTPQALAGLVLQANPGSDDLAWQLDGGAAAAAARGSTFAPDLPDDPGTHAVVLDDGAGNTRRLEIEILADGSLVVGCAAGAFGDAGPLTPTAVESTFDLAGFHHDGTRTPASPAATLAGGVVTVPEGRLAAVTLEAAAAPIAFLRHVQVLMDFDTADPLADWGAARPGPGPFNQAALQAWAAGFAGATFVAIGRCDDLGPLERNVNLAGLRAGAVVSLLTSGGATPVAPGSVFGRGEQTAWPTTPGSDAEAAIVPALSHAESVASVGDPDPGGWLIKRSVAEGGADRTGWPTQRDLADPSEPIRLGYRRVDVYAIGGTTGPATAQASQDAALRAPTLRRTLIPGADASSAPAVTVRDPSLPYRIRLVVAWDSPTIVELADAIPTKAEVTVAWQAAPIAVPSTTDSVTPAPTKPGGAGPEIYTLVGRWSYDARSGETLFSLGFDSTGDPNGLFYLGGDDSTVANVLATAAALGPALIAGIGASGIDGAAVRVAALVAASAFAAVFATNGKVVVFGVYVEERQQALTSLVDSRQRILFDYSAEIGFDVDAGPVHITADKPIRVRYKHVGIELDNSREGLDRLGFVFDNVSFEIEDPGQWTITGPLGELLRVTGSRAGSGSTWMEIDLAFALDLGIITITGATIRLTFKDGGVGFELRGLSVAVDIEGVLAGEGRVSIGDGGALRAGISVDIIPAKIQAMAALALQGDFVAIEVGVIFSVGIPLANSGLGIFGFVGRFVSNGSRLVPTTHASDPVQREIDWYELLPENKYGPMEGQWALGLGAVVGTLPDSAFTFNALGMFTIEFPILSVIFGIDAHFIAQPELASEQGAAPAASFRLLGIVAIDSTSIKLGIRGTYQIPKVLDLSVPVSGYFPFASPLDTYLRVGSDGFEGRVGDPVQLTFLPGTIDVRAWSYLMIEGRQLHNLGGDARFSFDGFSIGFGAGWGVEWSAGPLRLSASAKVLVGVGTRPLMLVAGVFVRGELDLVVVSASVTGEIVLTAREEEQRLDGDLCASVDLFITSVSGCVGIHVGTAPSVDIPVPASPLTGIDLTDRRGVVTALASPGATPAADDPAGTGPADRHTAWPDTVPVLHFAHYLRTALTGSAFAPAADYAGSDWSGTSQLKYAFRLIGLDLVPSGGAALAGPLDSAWWLPTHRDGVLGPDDPPGSEQEGRELALMSWHPAPWARNLSDGGAGIPADPAGTLGEICDPSPEPDPVCVLGERAVRLDLDHLRLTAPAPSALPFPSQFEIAAFESAAGLDLAAAGSLLAELGGHLELGHVEPLPISLTLPGGPTGVTGLYQLTGIAIGPQVASTVRFDGTFVGAVVDPELLLVVCLDRKGGATTETCDDYRDIKPGTTRGGELSHGGLTYRDLAGGKLRTVDEMPKNAPDGISELVIPPKGLEIVLPSPAIAVTATVASFASKEIVLKAFDAAGTLLSSATAPALPQGVEQRLEVSVAGIASVRLSGGDGEGVLLEVCRTTAGSATGADPKVITHLLAAAASSAGPTFPRVVGTAADGSEADWKPELVGAPVVTRDRVCVLVRYESGGGTWTAFRIMPFPKAEIGIVSCCAVTEAAAHGQELDAQARLDLVAAWNAAATADTARPVLLAADTTYEVRVRLQYQGWRQTDASPAPPSVDSGTWIDLAEDVFSFRTAAEPAPIPTTPPDFIDERTFDPRGLTRYLIGFDPDGSGPPHFLDDPILVSFTVDHIEDLLSKYDRTLVLKLRRTDPPAGSLHDPTATTDDAAPLAPPDEPISVAWKALSKSAMDLSDARLLEAAEASPCLATPPLGGTTAEVMAALEPDAEYDLLLVAAPVAAPDSDDVLIARSHFHTSKYRDPAGLVAAAGLASPAWPIPPQDFLAAAGVPGDVALADDQALQAALTTLGMDPWPLPGEPRLVTIWIKSGGWVLSGVLLDTDEPIARGTRCDVASGLVGATAYQPVRSNAAGTRVLLGPAGLPATVGPADVLAITLDQPAGPLTAQVALAGGPRVLAVEGLA